MAINSFIYDSDGSKIPVPNHKTEEEEARDVWIEEEFMRNPEHYLWKYPGTKKHAPDFFMYRCMVAFYDYFFECPDDQFYEEVRRAEKECRELAKVDCTGRFLRLLKDYDCAGNHFLEGYLESIIKFLKYIKNSRKNII